MDHPKNSKKYFEDFKEGFNFECQVPGLTVKEIKKFSAQYDPQRFHLDEKEASKTHFKGIIASGFQTQLLCFEPFCREVLLNTWAIGAPGIDNLRWLRPWYPGEALCVNVTLTTKRLSSKREDRGYLNFKLVATVHGTSVFTMEWAVIILTRTGTIRRK